MFYPSPNQWLVIWITIGFSIVFWIAAVAERSQTKTLERLAIAALVVGLLVVWKMAGPKSGAPER